MGHNPFATFSIIILFRVIIYFLFWLVFQSYCCWWSVSNWYL